MPEAGENLKLVQKVKKCPNGEGTFGPLNGLMVPPLKKSKMNCFERNVLLQYFKRVDL